MPHIGSGSTAEERKDSGAGIGVAAAAAGAPATDGGDAEAPNTYPDGLFLKPDETIPHHLVGRACLDFADGSKLILPLTGGTAVSLDSLSPAALTERRRIRTQQIPTLSPGEKLAFAQAVLGGGLILWALVLQGPATLAESKATGNPEFEFTSINELFAKQTVLGIVGAIAGTFALIPIPVFQAGGARDLVRKLFGTTDSKGNLWYLIPALGGLPSGLLHAFNMIATNEFLFGKNDTVTWLNRILSFFSLTSAGFPNGLHTWALLTGTLPRETWLLVEAARRACQRPKPPRLGLEDAGAGADATGLLDRRLLGRIPTAAELRGDLHWQLTLLEDTAQLAVSDTQLREIITSLKDLVTATEEFSMAQRVRALEALHHSRVSTQSYPSIKKIFNLLALGAGIYLALRATEPFVDDASRFFMTILPTVAGWFIDNVDRVMGSLEAGAFYTAWVGRVFNIGIMAETLFQTVKRLLRFDVQDDKCDKAKEAFLLILWGVDISLNLLQVFHNSDAHSATFSMIISIVMNSIFTSMGIGGLVAFLRTTQYVFDNYPDWFIEFADPQAEFAALINKALGNLDGLTAEELLLLKTTLEEGLPAAIAGMPDGTDLSRVLTDADMGPEAGEGAPAGMLMLEDAAAPTGVGVVGSDEAKQTAPRAATPARSSTTGVANRGIFGGNRRDGHADTGFEDDDEIKPPSCWERIFCCCRRR